LAAYADSLIARFSNPALPHRLAQIAMDGSQKIPQRWLATLADRQGQGKASPALLKALAAWIVHVRGDNPHVSDPRAEQLA
ncbi:mannitol dehydrogenase family protein, partial [Mycobacterium tuberculosis]|nr:mannitol dehydrogenase family protein [Mycobacterium tuberculosis]